MNMNSGIINAIKVWRMVYITHPELFQEGNDPWDIINDKIYINRL